VEIVFYLKIVRKNDFLARKPLYELKTHLFGRKLFQTLILTPFHLLNSRDPRVNPRGLSGLVGKTFYAKVVSMFFYLLSAANALPFADVCQLLQFHAID
jgi:hypothetical protein